MNKNYLLLSTLFFITLAFTACDKDDPVVPIEEEVITTLNYTLTSSGGSTVVLSFQDLDGDGGNDPTITGGTLDANETYTGSMELLNETESPAEDITEEIEEEDEEHQFFFEVNVSNVAIAYSDQDEDGNPIGLASALTTGDAATGTITVTLRHEPDKGASGVADGQIANAGGETDIEVTFPVTIE